MSVEGRGFVLDTNVIVSAAILRSSTPARALRRARQLGKILLSPPVVEELADVLSRPGDVTAEGTQESRRFH